MSDLGSHWNDLPFWALKLRAPRTDRGLRPAAAPRDRPGVDARRLRVRPARRHAAGQADLVPGRGQARASGQAARSPSGTTACCSSAPRGCSCPTTASTSSCPRRTSATSTGPSRSSPSRSAIRPSGSTPARPARHDLQLRVRRLAHRGQSPGQRRLPRRQEAPSGTPPNSPPPTPPRPSRSSAATTARDGRWPEGIATFDPALSASDGRWPPHFSASYCRSSPIDDPRCESGSWLRAWRGIGAGADRGRAQSRADDDFQPLVQRQGPERLGAGQRRARDVHGARRHDRVHRQAHGDLADRAALRELHPRAGVPAHRPQGERRAVHLERCAALRRQAVLRARSRCRSSTVRTTTFTRATATCSRSRGQRCSPTGRIPQAAMRSLPSEKRARPAPEWNHYRVTCKDGTITLAVNGKEVSGGSDCVPRKGYICLEAEGTECHFRNIRLQELPLREPVRGADRERSTKASSRSTRGSTSAAGGRTRATPVTGRPRTSSSTTTARARPRRRTSGPRNRTATSC